MVRVISLMYFSSTWKVGVWFKEGPPVPTLMKQEGASWE